MDRKTAGLISFSIIIFIMYAFGLKVFDMVWSFPSNRSVPIMVIALVGAGVYVTIKLGFPQIRYLKHGIEVTKGVYDNPNDEGDLNHFKALTTALSATVGIGNIAGVATAIYYGGPGAVFWMWITAFFGTTLKFAECTLSLKYREMDALGNTAGGPMYTIENGLGKNWRWMAVAFASFAVICSFATGNAIQSFTVSDQLYSEATSIIGNAHPIIIKHEIWDGFQLSYFQFFIGILLAIIVAAVIIGGISRIGSFTGFLAPFMALIYVTAAATIILYNIDKISNSFSLIIQMAFNPPATVAGTSGGILMTMLWGIKRGLYSNEAGQGSAAIAHSTAKTKYPVREGAVAMLGPYIDTLIICTMTALVIISTDTWMHTEFYVKISANSIQEVQRALEAGSFQGRELLNSSLLTSLAFKNGLSFLFNSGDKIVTFSVLLFAISTAIAWSFYGNRSAVYLFGEKAIKPYLYIYVLFVFIGAIAELETVWAFGDACLGMMTFPNLISIVLLIGTTKLITKEYFSLKHVPYKQK
jgi:AGCS family alanine or glycine:cation symporter